LSEVYFPTVDSPQVRDLGYPVTDGESFLHEEKRDLETRLEYLDDHALGYHLINTDPQKRYRIVKEIIADPHLPCVLIHTRAGGDTALLEKLRLYVLLAPQRALIYRAATQLPSGGFHQDFWIDGEPYLARGAGRRVGFPVDPGLGAPRARGVGDFDPYPMVLNAARYTRTSSSRTSRPGR
jgi:hypothetical protein